MSHSRSRRLRFISSIAGVAAVALTLSACGASSSNSAGTSDGTLTLAATAGPVSLDPMLQNVDPVNNWFVNLAYDSLIRLTPEGELAPDLAESWEASENNTVLTLKLRDDAKFSDGTPVTAQAVADSIDYARASGVNKAWLSTITDVAAIDDLTVVVTNSEPNDSLPFLFTQRVLLGSIISPAGLADKDALKSTTMGAGPYVLDADQTVANNTYVYTPNPEYWDPSKVSWDKVVIKVVSNPTAALQGVQSGDIDLFNGDSPTVQAATKNELGVAAEPFAVFGVNFVDRQGEVAPELADPLVRQALAYAIDRKSIAQAVHGSLGTPSASLTLPGFAGYSDEDAEAYSYDPEKAKSLLDEAGYPDGISFDMATTTGFSTDLMSQAIVENWKSVGVKANLTTYTDEGQLVTDVLAKKYPVTAYAYGALPQYIQAQSFFNGGANQYNPWNSTDDQINSDLTAAARASTLDEQDSLYGSALQRATHDLVWATNVLDVATPMIYASDRLSGVTVSSLNPSPDVAWSVVPAK